MTNPNLDQLLAAQKANTEVLVGLLNKAFDGVEKLVSLNVSASRELLDKAASSAEQLASIKDPKDLTKVGSALAQPNVDQIVGYSKSVYELVSSLQKEVLSVAEAQFQALNKATTESIEKAAASIPGGDALSSVVKSVLASTNQAINTVSATTKQLTEVAEANLKAASEAATKAVGAATTGKKK